MKSWVRKCVGASGALAAAVALSVVYAPSAQADSAYGCNYPEVCVYSDTSVNSTIVGRFKVVTSYWQYLDNPNTEYSIVNTRNDDVAHVKNSNGTVSCIKPNGSMSSGQRIVAIRIDSSPTC
ncbi:hypothetical protein K7395_01955 [Streptomyces filamentosus]|uniref:Peptidase inhibitor family I36 n=2 Tax=Streptomyces filamentosus TaxID=67294 RepID=A0ABY4UQD5_STRFL|nr:hypothetical protein [Streptomyces filamentosus]EFE79166.1 predicted protein [Streptomyces filamentosus NRRL 15998]EWS96018.1 hypothetical protein SSIG_06797 [Streptomyces filamentosus NRRL 11379]USC45575.1 hypothetical protein K7395_01955 [Streptomyces filamentosus]